MWSKRSRTESELSRGDCFEPLSCLPSLCEIHIAGEARVSTIRCGIARIRLDYQYIAGRAMNCQASLSVAQRRSQSAAFPAFFTCPY